MFCVVDITGETARPVLRDKGVFAFIKARRKAKTDEGFNLSRIRIEGFPLFYIFTLPKGKLLSEKALRVFAAYKNRLIFPLSVDLPEELAEISFNQKRYSCERMRVFTEEMLDAIPKKARIGNVLIRDKSFVSANTVLGAIPKMERVYAYTEDENAYSSFCERAMDKYGAVILRANEFTDLRRFDLIVDIDGGVIYYTPKSKYGRETKTLKPPLTDIPPALKEALPPEADLNSIAAAMYEICGFMLDNK